MSKLHNHPNIEMVDPATLNIPKTHARVHDEKGLEQIGRSIDRLGFLVPAIVGNNNEIAAGVGRVRAALLRGIELIPIIRVQFVSEADQRAFSLADNKLAELSDWDAKALKGELEFLFEQDYNFEYTGFELGDLDLGLIPTDTPEPPVELPANDAVAVSRPGDLWRVAEQALYNGNARDIASYDAVVGDDRATMVIGDPPYNVPIAGHVSGLGKVKHREFAEACGEMTSAEFSAFLRRVFQMCARFSIGGSIHYFFMDWRHIREMLDAADGVYEEFKQLIAWIKNNAGMGTFYRSRHELVFVFKSGAGKHINNFSLGGKGRYRTNVWEIAGANTFRKGRAEDLAAHPTVKPVELIADAILDCSNRGDLILDPFSGSGATLLAAHRTHRRGAAIEIDPLYVDVALRRLMAATGLPAILSDGRTFDQVAADRAAEKAADDEKNVDDE